MEILSKSTEDTKNLVRSLIQPIKPGTIILLHGDLGSGKTTFTRYLVESLGFDSKVQSPTFVLMRQYKTFNAKSDIHKINHLDLYRLSSLEEAEDLGLLELLSDTSAITIVEWPKTALPIFDKFGKKVINVYFEYLSMNERKIKVKGI